MSNGVSIEQYIATNAPAEAQTLLQKYGIGQGKTWDELHKKIRMVLTNYKDAAAQDLAQIDTPYKRLILSTMPAPVKQETVFVKEKEEKRSGCDGGCSGCKSGADGNKSRCPNCEADSMAKKVREYLRADGGQQTQTKTEPNGMGWTTTNVLMVTSLAFTLGWLIASKKI